MSVDRGMGEEDVIRIYNGILVSLKKEWNNPICNNMNGPRNYHAEWNETEKDNIPLICGI